MADSFLNIKLTTKGKLFSVNGTNVSIGKTLESALGDKGLRKYHLIEIGGMIRDKIETNIRNAKTYRGGNVAKLRPSTIKRKGHSRPLYETGLLANSVVVDSSGGNVIVRMANKNYKGGVSVPEVAQYLNEGTPKMVSRPFFGITKKDITLFTKTVIKDRLFTKGGFANLQNRKAS